MVGEERPPSLGGRDAPLREQPRDGAFGHIDAELRSSPWILWSAPERVRGGQANDQSLDLGVDGRTTPVGRPESLVQYSRKRRRCHRRTVSGVTITRGCLHPAQTLASPTQIG